MIFWKKITIFFSAQNKLNEGKKVNIKALIDDVTGHFDPENIENFSMKDLNRLIKTVAHDMENFDEKRHQKFKEYEMHKAIEREEKMAEMNEYEKAQFEAEEKMKRKRHMEHAKIPHPVSF